jgi:outer membrane protein with beta-barrel domain
VGHAAELPRENARVRDGTAYAPGAGGRVAHGAHSEWMPDPGVREETPMRAVFTRGAAALVLALGVAATASAQSFTVNVSYFALKGSESRAIGDVLNVDLGVDPERSNSLPLFFEVKDFNGASISGEYFAPVGDFIEVGGGLGFYQRTVPSVYEGFTRPGGGEIAQDLKLRVVPLTAAVHYTPLGRDASVQPYVGFGLGIFRWRYSEIGDFIDASDQTVFSDRFVATGTDVGPVVMGGVRLPIGDHFMTGGEIRWQKAEGPLPIQDFLGDKIDLGGYTFSWLLSFK